MRKLQFISALLLLAFSFAFISKGNGKRALSFKKKKYRSDDVILVEDNAGNQKKNYVHDQQIYDLGCDTLPQIVFWRKIMELSKDSGYLNIGHNRQVIAKFNVKEWNARPDAVKTAFRDSVRRVNNLPDSTRLLFTEGKSFFYDFSKAWPNLHTGIEVFQNNEVDPWYAQAILLIESPNKLQKSNVGAYGPFQLMKPVARMYGLKVNRKMDERADLSRAAYGASMLMKNICVPKTKEMLDTLGISYNEKDLWFRLLVLHAYHAGIGNVRAAIQATGKKEGGLELIQTLWHTSAKGFRSASQSYSQVALAAMLEMDERLGDKLPAKKKS